MATICGSCGGVHGSVKEVRDCYAGKKQRDLGEGAMAANVPDRGFFPDRPQRSNGGKKRPGPITLREGIYSRNGVEYKVKISDTSGMAYASVRKNGRWVYQQGAIKEIREKDYIGPASAGKVPEKGRRGAAVSRRTVPVPEAGMYRHPRTLQILKVYKAVHGSGNMCAKVLRVKQEPKRDGKGAITEPAVIEFEYLGLAVNYIDGHEPIPLDEARQFGMIYGCCMRCGRTLTDEGSIEAGLGTTCIKYFQGAA